MVRCAASQLMQNMQDALGTSSPDRKLWLLSELADLSPGGW